MSISRINTNTYSRAPDIALLLREYTDMQDSLAGAAAPEAAPAPQSAAPSAPPAKAIDNPRRGTRAFMERATSSAQNRVSNKRKYGDSSEVVQGDIPRWHRMDRLGDEAIGAIPQGDEFERGMRVDKLYMRRLGDAMGQVKKPRPSPPPAAPPMPKASGKWQFGLNQALRERAQFARKHGVLFDVPTAPSAGFEMA